LKTAANRNDETNVTTPSDFVYTNFDGEGQFSDMANDISDIAGNTSSMKSYTEEDLKYLRDIAERETINRIFNIEGFNITTNNTVNSELDLDGIADYIGDTMMERLEIVAEGV
jgi:hypothetical protein